MWIFVVTLLMATETVANNVTFESLTSIANEITQLPAIYRCKNDTEIAYGHHGECLLQTQLRIIFRMGMVTIVHF
ncbi:hypothetical protein GBAR_LOCUS4084 [Geodia barretti]|uniref:Secreted protein n=1 Tax=Geodia barretti TaxID=519541 RepID=A0AA35R6M5_GEOBA|nr:hypothetical protein GBAR_LOCUS4084 [Geodia barretti]